MPSLILYIENPKDSFRKLLELINEYNKVAGYKINTQKSLAFLCTNNERTKRETVMAKTVRPSKKCNTCVIGITEGKGKEDKQLKYLNFFP